MLRSRWLKLLASVSAAASTDDRALERYFRDEGLRVELEARLAGDYGRRHADMERSLYAAGSYFAS